MAIHLYDTSKRCATSGAGYLVTDNAGRHKHQEVKIPGGHDEMEILYLPTATPKFSAVKFV